MIRVMKEFKFRVLIDTLEEENAFRDISIDSSYSFEMLHEAIIVAFEFVILSLIIMVCSVVPVST
mgnify:CR=1 FL=1